MLRRCISRRSQAAAAAPAKDITSTLHSLRTRDITLRVPSKDKRARVCFCSTRNLLAETLYRHDLVTATGGHVPFMQMLGTHLSLTNLLASLQDGEERVESRFTGLEATTNTTALALGECNAYVTAAHVEAPEEGGQPPTFPLRVDRVLYNQNQPFVTTVTASYQELVSSAFSKVIGEREQGSRLAEQYLQSAGAAFGEDKDDVPPPPYALELQRMDPQTLFDFYCHNLTLHGYNYFRRSDGASAAVGLSSHLDAEKLLAAPRPTPSEDDATAANHKRAIAEAISLSYGVLVQPLAAGNAVDWSIWKLQRTLVSALAAPYTGTNINHNPLRPLREHCLSEHTLCQDMLSLITGDYDGAHEATVAARQYTQDPAAVARVVEPIRAQLGIADVTFPLDGKEVTRTGLDFFCRCSTANVLASLVTAPESVVQSLEKDNTFKCTYCAKVHHPKPGEWEHLRRVRAERKAAQG